MSFDSINNNSGISKIRELTPREALVSVLFFVLILIYITSFWGKAATYLPAPFDRWVYVYAKFFLEPWVKNVLEGYPLQYKLKMLWFLVCFFMAMLIPALLIKISKRNLSDYGLGLPNILGYRITIISILVSIPFGLWIYIASPVPYSLSIIYILSLLNKVPEHFVICGILIGLMLPGRKLPYPIKLAPIEGTLWYRLLRSFGLAQTDHTGSDVNIFKWFGINWSMLIAILLSGFIFWTIHWGRINPMEAYTSLPGGIAIAYLTIRTHSIWPTVIAHWTLNLVPLGILYLLK